MYINVLLEKERIINKIALLCHMNQEIVIKKRILKKLTNANVWGGKHMPLDFVIKAIPDHLRNTHKRKKVVERVLKELKNDEWIIIKSKKTGKGSGEHVSLNQRKVREILQFVEKYG